VALRRQRQMCIRDRLRTGKQNHQLNGFTRGVSYLPHDILKSFGKLKKSAPYDLIIVDPPSFQKGSFISVSYTHL
ncbi:class I SAM-dependent methyltransferase, partial [Psychrobacter sp. bablab_jr012]|uniref:class I SAM-dependent methyltransferase n=1 Tax=Psychrobacter sp. bablab_jr012 TaxID=2755061 RepID=UPI0018F71D43